MQGRIQLSPHGEASCKPRKLFTDAGMPIEGKEAAELHARDQVKTQKDLRRGRGMRPNGDRTPYTVEPPQGRILASVATNETAC
jgi:hypothetical protein